MQNYSSRYKAVRMFVGAFKIFLVFKVGILIGDVVYNVVCQNNSRIIYNYVTSVKEIVKIQGKQWIKMAKLF